MGSAFAGSMTGYTQACGRRREAAGFLLDLVIRNGRIIDGTGAPAAIGDVGVRDGRIAAVGDVGESARETLDAEGQPVPSRHAFFDEILDLARVVGRHEGTSIERRL